MRNMKTKYAMGSLGVVFAGTLFATSAFATEGYFQHGAGARQKAMGGAGVADSKDATALALNPAGLVDSDHSLTLSASIFIPDRGFVGSGGPGFTPSGEIDGNESSFFIVPNIAWSREWGENGAIGVTLYGNGGMNTDYADVTNPACAQPGLPATSGVFCGGEAGVNLTQAFISAGYAAKYENFSWGVAPILAIQMFEAKGLAAFGGISADPTNLTNNGSDTSTGFGIKLGAQWDVTENFRIGGAYQPKINMSEFDSYAGLFAEQGDFDIPANFQVGASFDLSPEFTVSLDYRNIKYSDIDSIANSGLIPQPLGSNNGPGFSWKDVDAFKLGAEWQGADGWTWRGGYAHNNNPIGGSDVTLNILAPGVVTDHFTGGFEKVFDNGQSLEAAILYVPENTVSGIEITPQGPNPGHTIELRMSQWEFTVGWKYQFGR